MYRILLFALTLILPVATSWWIFIPIAILAVYLVKLPYEIVIAAAILDSFYYFGNGFFQKNLLVVFAFVLIGVAIFLDGRLDWKKRI